MLHHSLFRSDLPKILVVLCAFVGPWIQAVWGERPPAKLPDGKVPEGYLLVPREEYQKLQDRLTQLEARLKEDKPLVPHCCVLTGKVEEEVVQLRATFSFSTVAPRTTVLLGCPQGLPSSFLLDGQVPVGFSQADNGARVLVEQPGEHQFVLEMQVPLENRDAERGLELGLPGCQITKLELDVPTAIKTVRVGNRSITAKKIDESINRVETLLGPGPVEKAELFWPAPTTRPTSPPVLSADAKMYVRITDNGVQTRTELTVRVANGKIEQLKILAPAQAEVKPLPGDNPSAVRIKNIEAEPKSLYRIIRLEAPTDSARFEVSLLHPRTPTTSVSIVPLVVGDCPRQTGTIFLSKPSDMQLKWTLKTEGQSLINPREITDDDRKSVAGIIASFRYWNVGGEKPNQLPAALVVVETDKIRAALETRINHTLTLTVKDPEHLSWRLKSQIKLELSQAGNEVLTVQLPEGFQYDRAIGVQPVSLVPQPEYDAAANRLRIPLERAGKSCVLTFEGEYTGLKAQVKDAICKLPIFREVLDRGSEIIVEVPDNYRLVPPRTDDPVWQTFPGEKPERSRNLHKHSWSLKRIPETVELAWSSYRPDLPTTSYAEVYFGERQAQVHQQLALSCSQGTIERIRLRVPHEIRDNVRLIGRDNREYRLVDVGTEDRDGPELWTLVTKTKEMNATLTLKYFFPCNDPRGDAGSERTREIKIPQVRVERVNREVVTQVKAFVQLNVLPGVTIAPATKLWEESADRSSSEPAFADTGNLHVEINEKWAPLANQPLRRQGSIPNLVLQRWSDLSRSNDESLAVHLRDTVGEQSHTVFVEAALIRVRIAEDGGQAYSASYRLGKFRGSHVELELPATSSSLNLRISWRYVGENGPSHEALPWDAVEDNGQIVPTGKVVRLRLDPSLAQRETVLEVAYQLPPPRRGLVEFRWFGKLQPPRIRGEAGATEVQWSVALPQDNISLLHGGLHEEWKWGLRGWLLGPRPTQRASDLDARLYPPELLTTKENELSTQPVLVLNGTGVRSVLLVYVPEQVWLLLVSAVFVVWFLGAVAAIRNRLRDFWILLFGAAGILIVVSLFWPTLFQAIVYGAQPGIFVGMVVVAVQWMLHQRYQRQVVFVPGFQRAQTGSSLVRGSNNKRLRSEPSTADLPTPPNKAWTGTPPPETRVPASE